VTDEYGPSTYGDRWADVYDVWGGGEGRNTAETVERLAELAGPGPVLELAIGTGRVALPLAERGVEVHGVDASEAMVAKLREKPGGGRIPVTIGDFADVPVEGRYALVFVVFNTFFGLLTQVDQVRCFANVAERLQDGGRFLVEAFVPDLGRFERGQETSAIDVRLDEVHLHAARHDPVEQVVTSQHVVVREEGVRLYPVKIRYAWPSELDLMARLAGLELQDRWAGWQREPFTASSTSHVSVYGRP
jgi:SAM-dependent methyltransferase